MAILQALDTTAAPVFPDSSETGVDFEEVLPTTSEGDIQPAQKAVQTSSHSGSVYSLFFLGEELQSKDGLFFFKAISNAYGEQLSIHDLISISDGMSLTEGNSI